MALSMSQFPVSSSSLISTIHPNISSKIKPFPIFRTQSTKNPTTRKKQFTIINAIEEPKSSSLSEEESESEILSTQQKKEDEISELGSEINKAMKERESSQGGGNFWSGVSEEIGEIEWPPFNKVLGTTGVVLGVIAGSSVVLLSVNAVLAELSDQVFAGRGFQDFFD